MIVAEKLIFVNWKWADSWSFCSSLFEKRRMFL